MSRAVPFQGDPPKVHAGAVVEIRNAAGEWSLAAALSEPRYDFDNAIGGKCFLTVLVDHPSLVAAYGHPVNWPAEDVRLAPGIGADR